MRRPEAAASARPAPGGHRGGQMEAPARPPSPAALAASAAAGADTKSGRDTVVLDVGDVLAITDFFVITSGANDRQVRAIVEEVERRVVEDFGPEHKPRRIEGLDALRWVLMDYGSFVVHILEEETRHFYDLERLWRDMPRLDWRALA
jgi:ribosome-associated protein